MFNELANACIFGNAPKLVNSAPMIRKQANGNFTGLVRKTFDNGEVIDSVFVENAKTHNSVIIAYRMTHQVEAA